MLKPFWWVGQDEKTVTSSPVLKGKNNEKQTSNCDAAAFVGSFWASNGS
jgi:hypothetical protein